MQPRRSLRLVAGALVLAVPLLSSCGFNKATDKVYTPAAGVNDRDGQVDVLSAVVVAAQDNSGTFIATLSNNSPTKDATLDSIAGSGDDASLSFAPVDPTVEVAAQGYVNLADDDGGVPVQGTFAAGDFLDVTLTYASGDATDMRIPVVYACEWWTGLDSSVSEEASASADASASVTDSAVPTEVASPTDGSVPTESASAAPSPGSPYDCGQVLDDSTSASASASPSE